MGLKCAHGVMMLVIISASMFSVSMANKDWSFGFNYTDWWSRYGNHPQNKTQQQPRQILVGGSEHWHFGYNYSDWAFKNAPFYINDTLVFKYDAPNATSFPHSVYMFKSFDSFLKCDLKKAKRVAKPTQGVGEGFKFVLQRWQPHYFACGERSWLPLQQWHHEICCHANVSSLLEVAMMRKFHPL